MTSLESWLEEVDVFVCAESPAIADVDTLEAQLEQSNVNIGEKCLFGKPLIRKLTIFMNVCL